MHAHSSGSECPAGYLPGYGVCIPECEVESGGKYTCNRFEITLVPVMGSPLLNAFLGRPRDCVPAAVEKYAFQRCAAPESAERCKATDGWCERPRKRWLKSSSFDVVQRLSRRNGARQGKISRRFRPVSCESRHGCARLTDTVTHVQTPPLPCPLLSAAGNTRALPLSLPLLLHGRSSSSVVLPCNVT
eukprot:96090-Rhodomonas_salina.1